MIYLVDCIPDDNDTLMGVCEAFPEINTFGEDVPHVFLNALGAIEEAVAARIAGGQDIPAGASQEALKTVGDREDGSTRICVKLPALAGLKIELYRMLRGDGQTRADLARRLDWNRESVDRLFRLDHRTRLEQFEAAFKAMGANIDLSVTREAR